MNSMEILLIEWALPAGIKIAVGPILLVVLALGGILWLLLKFPRFKSTVWDVVEAQIGFGEVGHVKIKRNHDTVRIAHQAWAELQTRKAALPYDEENDVITEVYDSWYSIFGEVRKLIKSIPAEHIQSNKDTSELVRVMIAVLNEGLRPHLTRWQARYRAWLETQKENGRTPQDTQRLFPEYQILINDLKRVNAEIHNYADFLKRIAHGEKT